MKFREIDRIIRKDGWILVDTNSSHHQYKHPTKPGKVTIPYHGSKDLDKWLINSILKQAGLK